VQTVANVRRALLHRQHPQSLRDRHGPLLGDHRSHQLRSEAYPQASSRDDRRRVDPLGRHQFAAVSRLERLAGGIGTGYALPTHQTPGLRRILLPGLILHTVAADEPCLSRDLPGDAQETAGTGPTEQIGSGSIHQTPRDRRRRGIGQLGDESQRALDAPSAGEAVADRRRAYRSNDRRQRDDRVHQTWCWRRRCRRHLDRLSVHRGTTADLVVQGEAGGEDPGRHHGRLCRLLAAILPHVRHRAILFGLLPIGADGILHHVARLYQ